jgi:2-C-methyl-D-erythritol 4-phosphate cytidylyltransferase
MERTALIVAGGKGLRMQAKTAKQFLILKGLPILMHTIKKFSDFNNIIVVLPENHLIEWENLCKKYKFSIKHIIVKGGSSRFESVKSGLKKITQNCVVAIHDGVRPMITNFLIDRLCQKVTSGVGIIPVMPIKESIRKIDKKNSSYFDRGSIVSVQTPQCFFSNEIIDAYSKAGSEEFTDDASVFEVNKGKISMLSGEEKNIKITTQEDLLIAETLLD